MPFPISIRGSIAIPTEAAHLSDEAIIIACVDQLEHERADVLTHTNRSVSFTTAIVNWGSNWRFTAAVSAGSLEIDNDSAGERHLRYDFSTRRIASIGTVMVVGLFVLVASQGIGQFPWWIPILFWLWLVGANYLLSFFRAPSWVRRRISGALQALAVTDSVTGQSNERCS